MPEQDTFLQNKHTLLEKLQVCPTAVGGKQWLPSAGNNSHKRWQGIPNFVRRLGASP